MSFELLPHQIIAKDDYDGFGGRLLCAMEMGLGKTIVTLNWLHDRPAERFPALIVVPAGLKYNWEYEAVKFFGTRASVCGSRKPPIAGFSETPAITIINYDVMRDWTAYLKSQKFRTVVLDECQAICNPRAKKTQATVEVAKRARYLIALSGTPMLNRPRELWVILSLLWPDEFSDQFNFCQTYCGPRWTPFGWNYKGASNLESLHTRLCELGMIRMRKADVMKNLPPVVRRIVPCEIENAHEYEEAKTNFRKWAEVNLAHIQNISRAEKLVQVSTLLTMAARLKMRAVVGWANRFLEETDEKLVLFAVHRKAVELLSRRVNAKSVVVTGAVTGRDRQNAVDQFQQDPETRVFIGNIQAGGVGITLTAASEMGIVEMPWRPGDLMQAEARTNRIGQDRTTFTNFLIAGGTIEEDLCKILQAKYRHTSAVLDGERDIGSLNLYDALYQVLSGQFGVTV